MLPCFLFQPFFFHVVTFLATLRKVCNRCRDCPASCHLDCWLLLYKWNVFEYNIKHQWNEKKNHLIKSFWFHCEWCRQGKHLLHKMAVYTSFSQLRPLPLYCITLTVVSCIKWPNHQRRLISSNILPRWIKWALYVAQRCLLPYMIRLLRL